MSAPLQGRTSVNAIAWALAWWAPLGAPAAIDAKRWAAGMPMPYRWATKITGPRTYESTISVIRIHTLAKTFTEAAREGDRTDNRAQVLVDNPVWDTVLPDGSIVRPLWLEITETAHEEPYAAESVATRFVSEYRVAFPNVAS